MRKKIIALLVLVSSFFLVNIATAEAADIAYEYDDLHRLARAIYPADYIVIQYAYDEAGNMISSEISQPDTDSDGLPDYWEAQYGLDPNDDGSVNPDNGPSGDPDDDDLNNADEYQHDTSPALADTDGDGLDDGWEVAYGLDPLTDDASGDADGDGYSNLREFLSGGDPGAPDVLSLIADSDHDFDVDGMDLMQLINEFGRDDCWSEAPCSCDFDEDGDVDNTDLHLFTEDYGRNNDLDSDGIFDDGDFSGVIGDFKYTAGNTLNCDDNCIFIYNPDQSDTDGDGIGDACAQ